MYIPLQAAFKYGVLAKGGNSLGSYILTLKIYFQITQNITPFVIKL